MTDYPESLTGMLAAWNESDPNKVRLHLEKALHENVHFVDPNYDIVGIDAFEKMVHAVQKQIPDAVYAHEGGFDTHHRLYRYHWSIHQNGRLIMPGFDVTELTADGQVCEVIGFFGNLND